VKMAEGVLSGIGSRSGNSREDAEKEKPTSSNDTFVGRFLAVIGGAFVTVPPTIAVNIATKIENPNWVVFIAAVLGCWLAAGLLIAAGLKWPKWRPIGIYFERLVRFASRTPAPPPFSRINWIPALSRAATSFSAVSRRPPITSAVSSDSSLPMVGFETPE
jgi:hypothetical protein